MICTSYYAKLKKLPDDIVPIAISATKPDKISIIRYSTLQPSRFMLMKYKITNNKEDYERHYINEILLKLSPHEVLNDLMKLSGGKDVCLICYEKPDKFCHRHIVAKWFRKNGIPCDEYTYDEQKGSEISSVLQTNKLLDIMGDNPLVSCFPVRSYKMDDRTIEIIQLTFVGVDGKSRFFTFDVSINNISGETKLLSKEVNITNGVTVPTIYTLGHDDCKFIIEEYNKMVSYYSYQQEKQNDSISKNNQK